MVNTKNLLKNYEKRCQNWVIVDHKVHWIGDLHEVKLILASSVAEDLGAHCVLEKAGAKSIIPV